MSARCLLLAFVLLVQSIFAEPAPYFPNGLAAQAGSVGSMLAYRDGVIFNNGTLHFADFDSPAPVPFPVEGLGQPIDIRRSGAGHVFLGVKDGTLRLVIERPDRTRVDLPLPAEIAKPATEDPGDPAFPRLVGTNGEAALMIREALWWREGGQWQSFKLTGVPRFDPKFDPRGLGDAHFLLGKVFFAGWDRGEFGGMLASIDLAAKSPRWFDQGYKNPNWKPGVYEVYQPVREILSPDGRDLWVATGLSHRFTHRAGLSRLQPGGSWSHLSDRIPQGQAGHLDIPPENSLETAAADPEGRVYVALFPTGIFRVGKTIEPLIKIGFDTVAGDVDQDHPFCFPRDLAISAKGDIFISTSGYGILAFRREGEVWKGRQILVKKEE